MPLKTVDMQETCTERKIFAKEDEYIGIGDDDLEPGDPLCIFLGGRTPYVFRPVTNHKYRFVGECNLYGIMQGESLTKGLAKEKLFTLI